MPRDHREVGYALSKWLDTPKTYKPCYRATVTNPREITCGCSSGYSSGCRHEVPSEPLSIPPPRPLRTNSVSGGLLQIRAAIILVHMST